MSHLEKKDPLEESPTQLAKLGLNKILTSIFIEGIDPLNNILRIEDRESARQLIYAYLEFSELPEGNSEEEFFMSIMGNPPIETWADLLKQANIKEIIGPKKCPSSELKKSLCELSLSIRESMELLSHVINCESCSKEILSKDGMASQSYEELGNADDSEKKLARLSIKIDPDCVINWFDQQIETKPNDLSLLAEKLKILEQLQRVNECIETVEKILKIDPKNYYALLRMYYFHLIIREKAKAAIYFEMAREINPELTRSEVLKTINIIEKEEERKKLN